MDDSKRIFKESNPDGVASRELSRELEEKRFSSAIEALEKYEYRQENLKSSSRMGSRLGHLSNAMREANLGEHLKTCVWQQDRKLWSEEYSIRYFRPFDRHAVEEYPGLEFETTPVAFDMYDSSQDGKVVGYVMLFRLGTVDEYVDTSTIGIGDNARYGAVIQNNQVQPIRIDTDAQTEVPGSELRKHDLMTSEESVDARVISSFSSRMKITKLAKDDITYGEVIDEIDKFIERCGPGWSKQ